jgi:hypothetical protein
MSALGNDTIEIHHAELVAGEMGDTRDWAHPTVTVVPGCSVQPVKSTEAAVDREYAADHLVVFAPFGTPLAAVDRVLFRAVMYEADGDPDVWFDLDGAGDHIEAAIKKLSG